MRLCMKPAFGSERVLLPLPLNMDQRPLPAAEQEVLDARKRQQVFGVYSDFIILSLRAPNWSKQFPIAIYHFTSQARQFVQSNVVISDTLWFCLLLGFTVTSSKRCILAEEYCPLWLLCFHQYTL